MRLHQLLVVALFGPLLGLGLKTGIMGRLKQLRLRPGRYSRIDQPVNVHKLVKKEAKTHRLQWGQFDMVSEWHKFSGMAAICVLSHKQHGGQFILKKLGEFSCTAEKRLKKEAQLLSTLSHPNVVEFLGVVEFPGFFEALKDLNIDLGVDSFLMEYANRGTIADVLNARPGVIADSLMSGPRPYLDPITKQQKREIIRQLLKGMQYLHRNNICHIRVSDDNVVVNQEDLGFTSVLRPMWIDFAYSVRNNWVVGRAGKLSYKSPEALGSDRINNIPYDCQRADIWAMGVLSFYIFANEEPFRPDGASDEQVKEYILNYNSPRLGRLDENFMNEDLSSTEHGFTRSEAQFVKNIFGARPGLEELLADGIFIGIL